MSQTRSILTVVTVLLAVQLCRGKPCGHTHPTCSYRCMFFILLEKLLDVSCRTILSRKSCYPGSVSRQVWRWFSFMVRARLILDFFFLGWGGAFLEVKQSSDTDTSARCFCFSKILNGKMLKVFPPSVCES